jgi:hypothetical protein
MYIRSGLQDSKTDHDLASVTPVKERVDSRKRTVVGPLARVIRSLIAVNHLAEKLALELGIGTFSNLDS